MSKAILDEVFQKNDERSIELIVKDIGGAQMNDEVTVFILSFSLLLLLLYLYYIYHYFILE